MKYVLIFWWSFYGNVGDMHQSVFVTTYSDLRECQRVGHEWLKLDSPSDIIRRRAFTCQYGEVLEVAAVRGKRP